MRKNKIYVGLTRTGKTTRLMAVLDELQHSPKGILIIPWGNREFEGSLPVSKDLCTLIEWEDEAELNDTLRELNIEKFDTIIVDEANSLETDVSSGLVNSPYAEKVFLSFQERKLALQTIDKMMKKPSITEIVVLE